MNIIQHNQKRAQSKATLKRLDNEIRDLEKRKQKLIDEATRIKEWLINNPRKRQSTKDIKLSKPQKKALEKLSETQWQSAYKLGIGLNTLQSLLRKELVEANYGAGSFSCPQVGIQFRKIPTKD